MIDQRNSVQLAVIGEDGERALQEKAVGVVGLGRVGITVVSNLRRCGVRGYALIDPQRLERENVSFYDGATEADLAREKVLFISGKLRGRPIVCVDPIFAPSDDHRARAALASADLIVVAANSIAAKRAPIEIALRNKIPLIDVGMADGKQSLAGFMRVLHPSNEWSACPLCYYDEDWEIPRGEGILATVASYIGAMGAQAAIQILLSHDDQCFREYNLFVLDAAQHEISRLSIEKRIDCSACSGGHRIPSQLSDFGKVSEGSSIEGVIAGD